MRVCQDVRSSPSCPISRLRRESALLPHPPELRGSVRLQRAAGLPRPRLERADASREALVGLAQRGLGIEALLARERDEVEQQLAEERRVVDVERKIDARGLEPDARGAFLQSI